MKTIKKYVFILLALFTVVLVFSTSNVTAATPNEIVVGEKTYQLVTDVVSEGTYIMMHPEGNRYVGKYDTGGYYLLVDNTSVPQEVKIAENSTGGFTLYDLSTNSYIAWKDTSKLQHVSTVADDAAIWDISFPGDNKVKIANRKGPTRFLGFNPNPVRLSTYTDSKAYPQPILYKLAENIERVDVKFFDEDIEYTDLALSAVVGRPISEPIAPVKSGYRFDGWYDSTLTTKWDFTKNVEVAMNLYAQWIELGPIDAFVAETTKASLNAKYNIISGNTEVKMESSKPSANTSMIANENNATLVCLDPEVFNVTAIKDGSTIPAANKDGIRMYTNSSLVVARKDSNAIINSISIVMNTGSVKVFVGDAEVTAENNIYPINSNSFKISASASVKVGSITINTQGDEAVVTESSIRFGTMMAENAYDANATYGVLLMKKTELATEGLTSFEELLSFIDLKSTIAGIIEDAAILGINVKNVACKPVRVNANGELAVDGEFYQFAAVINNISVNEEVVAVCYMMDANGVYFMTETTHSIKTAAQYYLENLKEQFTANEVLALEYLAKENA